MDDPVLEAISRLEWTFARSYAASAPHEYTRRRFSSDCDFRALFDAIQQSEVIERFNGVRYRYLRPGDGHQYWTMTGDIRKAILINRARVESI